MGNFIKIDRKILDWEWWSDFNTFRLFFYMLISAFWKDGCYKGIEIKRGSFPSSLSKLSSETGLTENEIRTSLKHLKSTGEITSKSHSKYTVFSVTNYDLYQSDNKQNYNEITINDANRLQTDNKQITNLPYLKEYKNKRNKEDKKYIGTHYPDNEELDKAFVDFIKMRDKIKKPMTTRAITRAKSVLQKLSNGDNELAIKIIEQSIYHCWQDLYALKENFKEPIESAKPTIQTQLEELSKLQCDNAEIIDEDEINRICDEKGW